MASFTKKTENKRARRHKNAGKKRKKKEGQASTPSTKALFAALADTSRPGAPSASAPASARPPK